MWLYTNDQSSSVMNKLTTIPSYFMTKEANIREIEILYTIM